MKSKEKQKESTETEPTETEIFVLTQHESISREYAIQLLKDFNSNK